VSARVALLGVAAWLFAADAGAQVERVTVGDPFVLGTSAIPAKQGELGALVGDRPAETGHPEPRVIIDATSAQGMKRTDAEAAVRSRFWGKVVGCYKKRAWADPELEVDVSLRLTVRGGSVRASRLTQTKKKSDKKQQNKKQKQKDEVAPCIEKALLGAAMPKTKKAANIAVRVRIYPGDEPIPPPADGVTKGDGDLNVERAKSVLEGAVPEFRACHDEALRYAPKLWGNLAVRIRIDEAGKVTEAFEVGGPFPEDRVTRCVLRRARLLRFDPPQGGWVRFIVPLMFTAP
jgi:hypothetical protein